MAKRRAKRGFGNVYERLVRGRSIGWYIRWSVRGVRHHQRGGATQRAAEAVLARLALEHDRDRLEGRAETEPATLAAFTARLWAVWEVSLRPSTVTGRRATIEWAAAALRCPMRDVTEPEAEALLLAAIRDGLAVSSVEARRGILRAAWELARRMNIVRENPWRRVRLPQKDREPDRVLTSDELSALYAACEDPRLRLAVVLMGETGMRRGEVCALTWRDVAADRGSVVVRGAVAKSHRFRTVPCSEIATAELERAWRERPGTPEARVVGMATVTLNKAFRVVADGLGFHDVTPHSLRHTVGHDLGDSGRVSSLALRDLLGHSSIRTTERYMGRASRRAVEGAVEALADLRHEATLRASSKAKRSEPRT